MSVQEAQSKISSREFYDWCLFFQKSPPIADRLDAMVANLCYFLVLPHHDKKKGKLELKDFLPAWVDVREKEEEPEDFLNRARMAFGAIREHFLKKQGK